MSKKNYFLLFSFVFFFFLSLSGLSKVEATTPTPDFVANPNDTQLMLSIKFQGVGTGGNPKPQNLTRHIEIILFDTKNNPVVTGNGFLKYDGSNFFTGVIHLGTIPNDTYYIKVHGIKTLTTIVLPQFQTISNIQLNTLPQVTLRQGDIDDNNIIDLKDYTSALTCFQDQNCPTKTMIDFNDDGRADALDYNLLLQNFSQYEGD